MANSYEYSNEPSCSLRFKEFLEWPTNCWLIKRDSAPWSLVMNICYSVLMAHHIP
jgi:hypothetical protein